MAIPIINVSILNGSNGFRVDGEAADDRLGYSVSNAGNVNGDGFDDVIVGARADRGDNLIGVSYVLFGKASDFDGVVNLSSLDGKNGFRLEGGDPFGSSVSSAGDVNDDGFDDLIIGEPDKFDNGASYVVFGGNFLNEAVHVGTPEDDNLTGTAVAERFEAGDGNDRMNGLGGADIFHGDGGDDSIAVADLDFQQVDGGVGSDRLELTGGGLNLNLSNFHDTIAGIETIDLTGSGNNTLSLTLSDLLSLSDTTDTFAVNSNEDDRITGLIDGWSDGGVDGDYRVFTNNGTTLRVNLAVRTDVPMRGVISLADLNGSNGFRLDGAAGDSSGSTVSNAGDVNGDGFDDVMVSAPGAEPNGASSGSSYVVFGKASGFAAAMDLSSLDGSNGFRLDGMAGFDRFGFSISNAGDINGDGFDDLICGAPGADNDNYYGYDRGSSYVIFGKASGFGAALDLSSLDGNNGFRLDGSGDQNSGRSVSGAGDVNGDGFDDVIVGAELSSRNGHYSGAGYVVFGKASGFNATLVLSGLDGRNGFYFAGESEYDNAGTSVSNAGDVNGDGFDDLIVGAHHAGPNGKYSGSSYVIFGKASGFTAAMDLSSLNGSNGFRLDGATAYDASGSSVSSAGDVNGDGFDDLIVEASSADLTYVVFGKSSGFNAALDLSNLNGSNGFRLDGAVAYRSSSSVSSAGDVNGDGFDDVIVGASAADYDSGSSYVVFGKSSGFAARLDLSTLDSNSGFRVKGVMAGDFSGLSVSSAGDVNGDSFDDVIVGAFGADPNGNGSGSSYVVFGRSDFGGGKVIPGTPDDDVLRGTSAAEIFEADDGNDVLIGGGGADVFHGGAGVDQIKVPDLNFESIDGGAGSDILHLAGADLNLDLTTFGDKIQGIETICLYGRGDNTLTLTADSVLDLSDTSNTLKLHGNAGDRVTVQDDGWVDGGVKGFYHTYTNDDAVLLVGANLAIDFIA